MKAKEQDQLLRALQNRFEKNSHRHKGHVWKQVLTKIEKSQTAFRSLREIEASGGEPVRLL